VVRRDRMASLSVARCARSPRFTERLEVSFADEGDEVVVYAWAMLCVAKYGRGWSVPVELGPSPRAAPRRTGPSSITASPGTPVTLMPWPPWASPEGPTGPDLDHNFVDVIEAKMSLWDLNWEQP